MIIGGYSETNKHLVIAAEVGVSVRDIPSLHTDIPSLHYNVQCAHDMERQHQAARTNKILACPMANWGDRAGPLDINFRHTQDYKET